MLFGELLGLSAASDSTNLVKCILFPEGIEIDDGLVYSFSLKMANCSAMLGDITFSATSARDPEAAAAAVAEKSAIFAEKSARVLEKSATLAEKSARAARKSVTLLEKSDSFDEKSAIFVEKSDNFDDRSDLGGAGESGEVAVEVSAEISFVDEASGTTRDLS